MNTIRTIRLLAEADQREAGGRQGNGQNSDIENGGSERERVAQAAANLGLEIQELEAAAQARRSERSRERLQRRQAPLILPSFFSFSRRNVGAEVAQVPEGTMLDLLFGFCIGFTFNIIIICCCLMMFRRQTSNKFR